MENKINILNVLTWLIFIVYLFNLFVPDYVHSYSYIGKTGITVYNYGNQDYLLKFSLVVLAFLPILILSHVKHTLASKVIIFVVTLLMLFAYYNFTFVFELINNHGFDWQDDYQGYYPNTGFYITCTCLLLMLIVAVLRLFILIIKPKGINKELIDDL